MIIAFSECIFSIQYSFDQDFLSSKEKFRLVVDIKSDQEKL